MFKDEGSFQLKQQARDLLMLLGSDKIASLGWRDMWAMITIKGGRCTKNHNDIKQALHQAG